MESASAWGSASALEMTGILGVSMGVSAGRRWLLRGRHEIGVERARDRSLTTMRA